MNHPEKSASSSPSSSAAMAAWWFKLFGGNKRHRSGSGSGSNSGSIGHKHFLSRSGHRGASRSVSGALKNQGGGGVAVGVNEVFFESTSEDTAPTRPSSLSDDDEARSLTSLCAVTTNQGQGGGGGDTTTTNNNLRRVREHRDLLQAALRVSQDSVPLQMAPPQPPSQPSRSRPQEPAQQAQDETIMEAQKSAGQRQSVQMRRSRSPVLPNVRPWDDSSTAVNAESSSMSRKPYRHRHDGEFCCPNCDEEASARAEEMYARATWRMYDRITRARAAAAAVRAAAQQQQQQHHGGHHQVPIMCVPAAVAVPQLQPVAARWVPLPPGVDEHDDDDDDNIEVEQHQDEDDDEEEDAVFSLDMDH